MKKNKLSSKEWVLPFYYNKEDKIIISADTETTQIDNEHYIVSIGYYDGNDYKTFSLWDFLPEIDWYSPPKIIEKSYVLVENFIESLFNYHFHHNKKIHIYFHNLSGFDGFLILKGYILCKNRRNWAAPEIIVRNNRIYQIKLLNERVCIYDSYLILPLSLEKCRKTFAPKAEPKIKFDIKKLNYDKYGNHIESILEYLKHDIFLLYIILKNASKLINNYFKVDIYSVITLPSLALRIFRQNFLAEGKLISKCTGNSDYFIRRGYFGGRCEVIKPHGKNLYFYDVNSLYPKAMLNYMPAGEPQWYEFKKDNIYIQLDSFFGFIECNITYNGNLDVPLLCTKDLKTGKLISPTGTWSGVYFSEELKLARTLGYEIKPLHGYRFKKKRIFYKYIKSIYTMKQNSSKDTGIYAISKLLLNSLYGRFGMSLDLNNTVFCNEDQFKEYITFFNVSFAEEITPETYVISMDLKPQLPKTCVIANQEELFETYFAKYIEKSNLNVAVQLSAAITAYSRMHMHPFLNLKNNKCYYTDTDSVALQYPLKSGVNNDLGGLKLEHKIKEAFFLAPKVYSIKSQDYLIKKHKGLPQSNIDEISFQWFSQRYQQINNKFGKENSDCVEVEVSPKPQEVFYFINNFIKSVKKLSIKTQERKKQPSIDGFDKRVRVFENGIWTETKPPQIYRGKRSLYSM